MRWSGVADHVDKFGNGYTGKVWGRAQLLQSISLALNASGRPSLTAISMGSAVVDDGLAVSPNKLRAAQGCVICVNV